MYFLLFLFLLYFKIYYDIRNVGHGNPNHLRPDVHFCNLLVQFGYYWGAWNFPVLWEIKEAVKTIINEEMENSLCI